jgi:hypothetical protein
VKCADRLATAMDPAPDERRDDDHWGRHGHYGRHGWGPRGFPIWGLFMVVIGVGWLGGEVGWWTFNWEFAGPLAIIFVGVSMMVAWAMRRSR